MDTEIELLDNEQWVSLRAIEGAKAIPKGDRNLQAIIQYVSSAIDIIKPDGLINQEEGTINGREIVVEGNLFKDPHVMASYFRELSEAFEIYLYDASVAYVSMDHNEGPEDYVAIRYVALPRVQDNSADPIITQYQMSLIGSIMRMGIMAGYDHRYDWYAHFYSYLRTTDELNEDEMKRMLKESADAVLVFERSLGRDEDEQDELRYLTGEMLAHRITEHVRNRLDQETSA